MFLRAVLLALLALPVIAQETDDKLWNDYVQFIKGQDGPQAAAAYRTKLLSEGMTEQQSWDRIFLIDKLRKQRRQELWTSSFNRFYSTNATHFSTEPNAFLASVIERIKPGAALHVSMGQGRNTVFLATKGWTATGFDPAEEGMSVAQESAAKAGVKIRTIKATYEEFDFGREQWDLIVFCYAFAPLSDPALVRRVHESLKPGGLVLIEHPMNEPGMAMHAQDKVNSLPKAFGDSFRILLYEDTMGISEWQQSAVNRTEDTRRIVRFLARKLPQS